MTQAIPSRTKNGIVKENAWFLSSSRKICFLRACFCPFLLLRPLAAMQTEGNIRNLNHIRQQPSSPRYLVLDLLGTTEQTSSPGSDETRLLTFRGVPADGRGLTDMLVVTTSVRLEYLVSKCVTVYNLAGPLTWSTGFMATPRVLGQLLRLAANLCLARDALSIGLSVLPPPATIPTIPRTELLTTFLAPLGSLILVLPSSGLWPMTVT